MPKSHRVPNLSVEEEMTIREQEEEDRFRIEEDEFWQQEDYEISWDDPVPQVNNNRYPEAFVELEIMEAAMAETDEKIPLTQEQISTIRRNGFTAEDGVCFPCWADADRIHNWEEMLDWMITQKMDNAS